MIRSETIYAIAQELEHIKGGKGEGANFVYHFDCEGCVCNISMQEARRGIEGAKRCFLSLWKPQIDLKDSRLPEFCNLKQVSSHNFVCLRQDFSKLNGNFL